MLYFSFFFSCYQLVKSLSYTHTHTTISSNDFAGFGVCPFWRMPGFFALCHVQQVQAVLLLLGGRDVPTGVPTIEVPFNQNNRVPQNLKL